MVQLQLINRIIASRDVNILQDNLITREYFVGYENEIDYILAHCEKYGNVPDKATFSEKFPNFDFVDVTESDKYLIDTIKEEYLYYRAVPVVQEIARLIQIDANSACEYMIHAVDDLKPDYDLGGTDIISQAEQRLNEFNERKEHQDTWFFPSGFAELDEQIHGLQRKEELVVIYARTNEGKSWVLEKICSSIWQLGYNVGYISPEMGAVSVGYRFDTLTRNFSNKGLMWGKDDCNDYAGYIHDLKTKKNKFVVATPKDFNRKITVTKIKQWVQKYKLDFLAVDGITYITDERGKKTDNKTTSLTNISEDLMSLSIELNIPVLVVVQANRNGVSDSKSETPELDTIRDSDGIAHNASKVISLRQMKKDHILIMEIKKQRFGSVGGKLYYQWQIDTGEFQFIPSFDDAEPEQTTEKKTKAIKREYKDAEDVF